MILFVNGATKMKKKNKENNPEVTVIDSTVEQEQAKEENPNVLVLSKEESDKPFNEIVEEERQNLYKVYKSTSRRNNIIMVAVVAIFIGAFIAITRGTVGQIIGWVLVGTTLAGLVTYYILTRNLFPNTSKRYFQKFWKATNDYLFQQDGFDNCQINTTEKYQLADILAERVYKDVVDIASRNLVRGEYNNKPFTFGELALYRPGAKRNSKEVVFVGRHLDLENKYEFEGHYVVNIKKAENAVDLPNDIEDLVPLVENNLFTIYGPEGTNPEKVLGKELLDNLKAIECTGALLNVNVVFWAHRTACYLSFDDSIVAIPFEQPIHTDAYVSLKRTIQDVFEILESK